MIEHVLVGVALVARPRRRLPDRPLAPARAPLRPARGGPPDPPALHRHRDLPPRPRRRPAPGPRRGRDPDARLPGRRCPSSCRWNARSPTRRAGRCRCWRRSSSAPPPRACRSTPGSSAAAPTATRWSACSTRETFDRVVVPASASGTTGLSGDDLVWLLEQGPGRGADPAAGAGGSADCERQRRGCEPGGPRDWLRSETTSRRPTSSSDRSRSSP